MLVLPVDINRFLNMTLETDSDTFWDCKGYSDVLNNDGGFSRNSSAGIVDDLDNTFVHEGL